MPKWKLVIEYEGTRYRGWQEQKNARTVQGELRRAAEELLEGTVDITGSGRTDAGVHALCQVAHLRALKLMRADILRRELNDRLPADINIREVREVSARFHARHHAKERFYLYQIATERTAFAKRFVWWVRDRLDAEKMSLAAARFCGKRDFSIYREKEEDPSNALIDVRDCRLRTFGEMILFRIGASHFLWKMVRRIVGVLVEVGRGRVPPESLDSLTAAEVARWTAPPSGLFLEYVRYPGDPPPGPLLPAVFFRHQAHNHPEVKP